MQGQEAEKGRLESELASLRMELKAAIQDNNRLFQENERNKQLVEKMRLEHKSKEMEINNFRIERRFYNRDLNSIEALRHDLTNKIKERTQTIEDLEAQLRALHRENSDYQSRCGEMERDVEELEVERQELREEVRDQLEKYLSCNNQIGRF